MYTEDRLLPISGLQHIAFCERQCALIHLEQVWEENYLTATGRVMHDKVHHAGSETRGDLRIDRGLVISSRQLGLAGIADAVEFHRVGEGDDNTSPSFLVRLPRHSGLWRPIPIEYKRGRPKVDQCDAVQLCAQALCLEEMMQCHIPEGALYYGETRHRLSVLFDKQIRQETANLALKFHQLMEGQKTPLASLRSCCKACSLKELCFPGMKHSVSQYIEKMLEDTQ